MKFTVQQCNSIWWFTRWKVHDSHGCTRLLF